jgi:ABC-type dipeptide/oligopeptide/nickel transport system ATPase component
MAFTFSIPTLSGPMGFEVEVGTSLYFVGANGGGKTRLAVMIEEVIGENAHRISAHRALSLNPEVPKVSQDTAARGLRYGYAGQGAALGNRTGSRWGGKAAVQLLNDYDFLLQVLFAEQSNTSLQTHKNARAGLSKEAISTKFEKLNEIWGRLLPHRKLDISGDNIKVFATESDEGYPAHEMSDGERATFYLIGQTLAAPPNSLIIFDEPELHIHRSILAKLWDELEAARPDCGMVVISHDLEFVASREGQKFVIQDYSPSKGWIIEAVPENTGFAESVVSLILGSRRAVLFVEGDASSLDQAIYRACYPNWTIISRGSCEEVIHAVITMRANPTLTRVTCAGVVDADAYDSSEITFFKSKGIEVLPVAEIENLFLMPEVVKAIAQNEGYDSAELDRLLNRIMDELFLHASDPSNQLSSVMRYCRRRIDRTLKKIDLSNAKDVGTLVLDYATKTSSLDINSLAQVITSEIQSAISHKDCDKLLKWYDNKGILSIAAKIKGTTKTNFEQWLLRSLRNGKAIPVANAIQKILPIIKAA